MPDPEEPDDEPSTRDREWHREERKHQVVLKLLDLAQAFVTASPLLLAALMS